MKITNYKHTCRSCNNIPSCTYHHHKLIHTKFRIVRVLLGETGVDDVVDTVDRDTGFGNVGGNDTLSCTWWCRVEDT